MDAKLVFWTYALALMAMMVAFGFHGWRQIRRGQVDAHRRSMNVSIALFFTFILSYVLKLRFLGREVFSTWSQADITILRIHETFVLIMFLAGLTARLQARYLVPRDTANRPKAPRRHRLAGRTATVSGALALITACLVLLGMYGRAL